MGTLVKPPARDASGAVHAVGRRKCASASVWIAPGDGAFVVNGRPLSSYFSAPEERHQCLQPLVALEACGAFDVRVHVRGGGVSGQVGAVAHALARALVAFDPYLKPVLKRAALLKRDPRMVERKKPGQKKARKKFQWVKR
jgi:small subunit ribosomal protein S9